jgi:MATE family multidrug resistance protein
MFCADWLGIHILILFSSYLDEKSLVVNIFLFNYLTLIMAFPMGISFSSTVLIGHSTGSNKVESARIFAVVSTLLAIVTVLFITLIFQCFKIELPYLYTNNADIAAVFSKMMFFLIFFSCADTLQLLLNGILKGLGKQKPASFLVLIILYPINIPMAYTFAFALNYGMIGLWYSQITAVLFLIFAYFIMILSLDWENNTARTIIKIAKVSEKLERKSELLTKFRKD